MYSFNNLVYYIYIMMLYFLQSHINDKNSTMWELTTKFQKHSSVVDYSSSTLINDNDMNMDVRIDDLFLISNEVKVC